MQRLITLLLVTSLVASTIPALGTASQGTYVSVSDVSVSPQDPAPGEQVTITPTIRNLEGSPSVFNFDSVAVRMETGTGVRELTRVRDLGTLSPGSEIDVPLSVEFSEPGTKRLRVYVFGSDGQGNTVQIRYPVVIRVAEDHPQLDVSTNDTVASTRGQGQITVANGLSSEARNVEVRLSSDGLNLFDSRTVRPTLASGETATETFQYEADEAGTYFVRARLRYTIEAGKVRTTEETFPVEVDPRTDNVILEATRADDASGSRIAVDILNRGNLPIENVAVSASSTNATIPQRLVSAVPPQSSRTVVLNASLSGDRATVDVTADYEVGPDEGQVSDTAELTSTPGQIDLTGVQVEPGPGALQITGSAANVGLTEANSVVVGVVDTEKVSPANPSREYFVGTVPASDFVSFDVNARVEGNVSSIPVRVTYLVDGERQSEVVEVDYAGGAPNGPVRSGPPDSGSSNGLLVPAAIGAVVLLGVGAIVYVGWRNSRDRT